jgi:hypothetical protein
MSHFGNHSFDASTGFSDPAWRDLSDSAHYGQDAAPAVVFLEARRDMKERLWFNPYIYWQNNYATVVGGDIDWHWPVGEAWSVGALGSVYHVFAEDIRLESRDKDTGLRETRTQRDALCGSFAPYVRTGPIEARIGYAIFDGSYAEPALNRPRWLRDYMVGVLEEDNGYGMQDAQVAFALARYNMGRFWIALATGHYHNIDRGPGEDRGRIRENQMSIGYDHCENVTFNLRVMDIDYTYSTLGVANDYVKIEFVTLVRF